jgi:hypothetical protein
MWEDGIKKLEDSFGDYLLDITCPKCNHERLNAAMLQHILLVTPRLF